MISQREAHRLRKRVAELENREFKQKQGWVADWGANWTRIEYTTLTEVEFAAIKTARALGHAVIVLPKGDGSFDVNFFAVRL